MKKSLLNRDNIETLDCKSFKQSPCCENVKIEDCDLSESEFEDLSLDKALLSGVVLNQSKISDFEVTDSCIEKCSFAGVETEKSYFLRTEFKSSRLQGVQLSQSRMSNVIFIASKLNDANIRYSKLKNVVFDSCDMSGLDFIGAELENVSFVKCNLSGANFSQATLKNTDLAGSTIENIIINVESVKEVFVDTGQALYLSSVFGLKVRD